MTLKSWKNESHVAKTSYVLQKWEAACDSRPRHANTPQQDCIVQAQINVSVWGRLYINQDNSKIDWKSKWSNGFHQGTDYVLGDFAVKICRTILKPGEEVKGVALDIEYMPASDAAAAHPALLVRVALLWADSHSCTPNTVQTKTDHSCVIGLQQLVLENVVLACLLFINNTLGCPKATHHWHAWSCQLFVISLVLMLSMS